MKNKIAWLSTLMLFSGCVSTSKFESALIESKTRGEKLATLETSLASLQTTLTETSAELAKSNQKSMALGLEISQLQQTVNQTAASAATRESELATKLADATAQIGAAQKSNAELQEALKAKKGELTSKIGNLIKERDGLTQTLADAHSEAAKYKRATDAQVEDMEVRISSLTDRVALQDAALQESLAARLSQVSARDKTIGELGGRVAQLTASLAKESEEKQQVFMAKELELNELKDNYEVLTANLKAEIAGGEVTITQLKGKLTVNMVDRILFDSGQVTINDAGKKVLEKIGVVLNGMKDKDIRIEGHTDDVPIRGVLKQRFASNWELSASRATAMVRYLEDHADLDPSRMAAIGFGEHHPIAPNDTPENRALNRRIEIVLVPREAATLAPAE